ncbi:MAG: DNA-directed RNA polymerase subunit omega [Cytophagales bacterium]|nr:DNA-directed RNA polymerase subunit omega [Cytophagales bacterium]
MSKEDNISTENTSNITLRKKPRENVLVNPENTQALSEQTGSLYKAIVIIGKRARQISQARQEELKEKLEDFAIPVDSLEEVFENLEQIEISRRYERMPKPTLQATKELLDGKVIFRQPEKEE